MLVYVLVTLVIRAPLSEIKFWKLELQFLSPDHIVYLEEDTFPPIST